MLASLQQVQSILVGLYPGGAASTGTSDSSTIDSFNQILAALSPASNTSASGIMGAGITGSASATAATTPGGPTGADIVADAKKYLNTPYVLGGESSKAMDCSGLVQVTYKDFGITLPRLVHQQKTMGTAVPALAQAQPGDLIVFKGGGHIAIYEGNNTVIHAPYPGRVVCNEKLWVGDSGIETIRRIVPSAGPASTAPTTPVASTKTSAAVQAAALAAVQAIMQADFGLLSSTPGPSSRPSTGASSASSQLQTALSSLEAASGVGTSTTASTTVATSATSAQQALAMEQSMLAQEEL